MPKETLNDGVGFTCEVTWPNAEVVQLRVDSGREFDFREDDTEDGPYTGLSFTFYRPEEIDALIKVLRTAKRKTFV